MMNDRLHLTRKINKESKIANQKRKGIQRQFWRRDSLFGYLLDTWTMLYSLPRRKDNKGLKLKRRLCDSGCLVANEIVTVSSRVCTNQIVCVNPGVCAIS